MNDTEGADVSPVELALAAGIPQQVGWFRLFFADERWEWSAEVEAIHGYKPGTAHPTTEVVLGHKHPDDVGHVQATLNEIRRTHTAFSTRHRIVTVQGHVREVVVIGERMADNTGHVIGTQGFYLDVTPTREARDATITEAVSEIIDQRAVIDQVKGVLRMVYRIDDAAAFGLLRWRSQDANVKLRALAEQLMQDFENVGGGESLPPRREFDRLLLTAHQRVQAAAAPHH